MTVTVHGPHYPHYTFSIDGYAVPHLTATRLSEQEYNLHVRHYSVMVHKDDLDSWVWFIANAMAIAEGYTSHGEFSHLANPYNVRRMEVGSVNTSRDDSTDSDEQSEE